LFVFLCSGLSELSNEGSETAFDDGNLSDIMNDLEAVNNNLLQHNLRAIKALDFTQSDHESEAEMDQR
jgi:hypothetical protein